LPALQLSPLMLWAQFWTTHFTFGTSYTSSKVSFSSIKKNIKGEKDTLYLNKINVEEGIRSSLWNSSSYTNARRKTRGAKKNADLESQV